MMRKVLKLAAPVALSNLGLMLMGFVDTLILGRLGSAQLGGAGLGNSMCSWIMVAGIGLMMGLDFPVAHAFGAGKPREAFDSWIHANLLAWIVGTPIMIALWFFARCMPWFGFDPVVVPYAQIFIRIIAFSMIPVFGFNSCRAYLQAQGIVVQMTWILIAANLLNLVLSLALVWGRWGFPVLGFTGSPIATFVVRFFCYLSGLGLVFYFDRQRGYGFFREKIGLAFYKMKPILELGIPAALHNVLEVGIFALATALAAKLSATELAAHHIVLTTASLTFMVSLGISSAAATLVGQAMGARDQKLAEAHGMRAFQLVALVMGFTSLLLLVFSGSLLRVYTQDQSVIPIARNLLLIASFFQLGDGIQVVGAGVLRGIGETRATLWANLVGHWFIGFPLSIALGFYSSYRVAGLWVGLATGLFVVAASLFLVWRKRIMGILSVAQN